MKWRRAATVPFRALGRALKAFSMRWSGATSWRPYFLPRTRFDYAAEIGDGRNSNIIVACINWVARAFPEAPVIVVEEKPDGTRETIPGHKMPQKLERPNPYYSGVLMWMATIADFEASGNGYWLKQRARLGNGVAELWWAPSWTMEPKWPEDGRTYLSHYDYRPDPGREAIRVDPKDVVHFRYGLDPENTRKGLSPLRSLMREIFTDDEAANFTASLMRNLGVPGVVLSPETIDARATPEQAEEMKQKFMEKFGGDRRGEPMVMTAPTKVSVLAFSPEQMLLRELRRIPEERVSAVIGVPAMVVGLGAGLDRTTFTNYKEARAAAWDQKIIPAQRLMAADLEIQLLPDFETRDDRDVDFDLTRVRALQPDQNDVFERATRMVNGGWGTIGQALRMVGLPAGPEHEMYLRPMTVMEVPARSAPKAKSRGLKAARVRVAAVRRRLAAANEERFAAIAAKLIAGERAAIMGAAERLLASKATEDLEAAISEFYADYDQGVAEQMAGPLAAYAELVQPIVAEEIGGDVGVTPELTIFLSAYAAASAKRWAGSSRGQLLDLVGKARGEGGDVAAALTGRFDEWAETRPGKYGAWETAQASNAIAHHEYGQAGIEKEIWVASGNSCPYCQSLNGMVVAITQNFIEEGQEFQPEGAERPLVTETSVGHPPAHGGCTCVVMAA